MYNKYHSFAITPQDEGYRFEVLDELLSLRNQLTYFEDDTFSVEDIDVMIGNICTG